MFISILLFISSTMVLVSYNNDTSKANPMDKIEIMELIHQYAKNTDLAAAQASADMFTEDGILSSLAGTDQGKKNILIHLERVANTVAKGKRHVMTNVTSTITGDKATSTSYMIVFDATNSTNVIMTCVYNDELVKVAGQWKFKSRKLMIDPSFQPPNKH